MTSMTDMKILRFIKEHDELLIFATAFLIEIAFGLVLISRYGNTLFDIDAISYLYNSRTVIDKGEYSGMSVLVGTWLPVFQIMLIPFTMIDKLYTTGFAGTIVNAAMTAGIAVFLYRMAGGGNINRKIAILAPVLFMSNIYVIIFGVIPMSEQTAIFFMTAASYYFKNYLDSGKLKEFISCSFVLIFGSLTRYEIWVIAIYVVAVFALIEFKNKNFHRAGYIPLPLLGIAGWLFANYLIHKDFLWFTRNPLSVGIGQGSILSLYPWLYYFKDSIYLTLNHAFIQMNMTFGLLLYMAVISSLILFISNRKYLAALLVFFIPAAVNVYLMFRGESIGWQRYFYTSVPGIILLNIALLENVLENVSWLAAQVKRFGKTSTFVYGKKKHFNYDTAATVLIIIVFVSIASAAFELNSHETGGALQVSGASLSKEDNRPWIFQGLDISNNRIVYSIDSYKGEYRTDLSFDMLDILPAKNFTVIKNVIGNEKILMAYPDISGYHPNLFSVSQGVPPSQIIDDFNYLDYRKIMMQPWEYVKFVLVPVKSPSAAAVNKWYNGTFYLYNYESNQTWRSEFLNRYEPVLDNENYKLYKLKDKEIGVNNEK